MTHVIYKVVRHEDGWAYTAGGTFSETFPSHEEALEAARRVATEQRRPGQTEAIEYEDENGKWHSEVASGRDRPETEVEDSE
jgi:predicted DNA-binding WGR domain protein